MYTHGAESPHKSLARRIADWLRLRIADGTYARGSEIPSQGRLAELFTAETGEKVSRIPVREALRQLEMEGLVRVIANQRSYVTNLGPEDFAEIYDLRARLEPVVLEIAFDELTPKLLAEARAVLERLDMETDSDRWRELDEHFHTLLYERAQRPRYLEIIATLRRQVTHLFFARHSPDEYRAAFQPEHWAILEACEKRNKEEALAALRLHISKSADAVTRKSLSA